MGRPFADTTVAEPHTSRLHTFLRSLPKQATQAHSTPHHSTIAGVGRPDHSQPLHPYMFTCAFIELSPAAPCPNQCKLSTNATRVHPTEQCIHCPSISDAPAAAHTNEYVCTHILNASGPPRCGTQPRHQQRPHDASMASFHNVCRRLQAAAHMEPKGM